MDKLYLIYVLYYMVYRYAYRGVYKINIHDKKGYYTHSRRVVYTIT